MVDFPIEVSAASLKTRGRFPEQYKYAFVLEEERVYPVASHLKNKFSILAPIKTHRLWWIRACEAYYVSNEIIEAIAPVTGTSGVFIPFTTLLVTLGQSMSGFIALLESVDVTDSYVCGPDPAKLIS